MNWVHPTELKDILCNISAKKKKNKSFVTHLLCTYIVPDIPMAVQTQRNLSSVNTQERSREWGETLKHYLIHELFCLNHVDVFSSATVVVEDNSHDPTLLGYDWETSSRNNYYAVQDIFPTLQTDIIFNNACANMCGSQVCTNFSSN